MNSHLQKTDENNGKRIFVFECSYFDQNQNISSSKKFTKKFIQSQTVDFNPCGCFEKMNLDLALNTWELQGM